MEVAGSNVAEEFSVGFANFFPVGDVDHVHAGADNIFHGCAGFLQRRFDVFQGLHGLGVNVADTDDFAVCPSGRGAGHVHVRSNFYCPGVTNDRFPGYATRDVLPFHERLFLPVESLYREANAVD